MLKTVNTMKTFAKNQVLLRLEKIAFLVSPKLTTVSGRSSK